MKRRTIIGLSITAFVVIAITISLPTIYRHLDEGYQKAQDPVRQKHVDQILGIVATYKKKVGHLPLEPEAKKEGIPFMAVIGRNEAEEDYFANLDVLRRGGGYVNSTLFERILTEGLGQTVNLPRDPQSVATYAPNVYLYFISPPQVCAVAHLYFASNISKEYEWEGGKFHSHAKCYEYDSEI